MHWLIIIIIVIIIIIIIIVIIIIIIIIKSTFSLQRTVTVRALVLNLEHSAYQNSRIKHMIFLRFFFLFTMTGIAWSLRTVTAYY